MYQSPKDQALMADSDYCVVKIFQFCSITNIMMEISEASLKEQPRTNCGYT